MFLPIVLTELLIILALVLLNGVFAGAEIAILSLRKTRLQELVEEGSVRASAVARLRENPESFLATVQIGITVVSAAASAFAGAEIADELAPTIAAIPALERVAPQVALALVIAFNSYLSLVLGELVPKSLALRAGETYALLIGPPLASLAWLGRPVVALLTMSSNFVLRAFGDKTTFSEARLSRDELQQIVEEASTTGSVDPHAGEIASRALDFSGLDVYTVMVPRSELVLLPVDATPARIAEVARRSGHARIPVYEGTPDNIIGFINLREVLAEAVTHAAVNLQALLHPVPFVPDTMPAPAVLRKLQSEHTHLALVIDEQGTIVGLVTIEDLVEELVGEIFSENDKPIQGVFRESDGVWVLAGSLPLHDLNRKLGLELPEGDFSTLAGLCLSLSGAMPAQGAVLTTEDGVTLEIIDVTPRRIRRVRLSRPQTLVS
jgi:putative hemolysin